MFGFWLVVAQLAVLVVFDLHRAYKDYVQDKKVWKLALHGVMLSGLCFLVVNTVLFIVGYETDMPYIQTHVLQTDPRFLRLHRTKHHKHAKAPSRTPGKQRQPLLPQDDDE